VDSEPKAAPSFAGRIISGVLCGLALASSGRAIPLGAAVAAIAGAVVGTLGGYEPARA
jgi:uncharacterized membrane protein